MSVDFKAMLDEKEKEEKVFKLSEQAVAALMVSLQKSLLEQSDIVPTLKGWELKNTEDGLVVLNPPTKIEVAE